MGEATASLQGGWVLTWVVHVENLELDVDSEHEYFLSGSTGQAWLFIIMLASVQGPFLGLSDMCIVYNYLFVSGHSLPMGRFLEDRKTLTFAVIDVSGIE